jgi:hypothetical protein
VRVVNAKVPDPRWVSSVVVEPDSKVGVAVVATVPPFTNASVVIALKGQQVTLPHPDSRMALPSRFDAKSFTSEGTHDLATLDNLFAKPLGVENMSA